MVVWGVSHFQDTDNPASEDSDDTKGQKKVHFQEAQEHFHTSLTFNSDPDTSIPVVRARTPSSSSSTGGGSHRHVTDTTKQTLLPQGPKSTLWVNQTACVGNLLTIRPALELIFQPRDTGELSDVITLTNSNSHSVAFKIKTTSPEKFKVRPSSGIIESQGSHEVHIHLSPDQADGIQRDKFLVLAVETKGDNVDLHQLFKAGTKEKILQHKLRCSVGSAEVGENNGATDHVTPATCIDQLTDQLCRIQLQNTRMSRQVKLMLLLQLLLTFTFLLFLMTFTSLGQGLLKNLPFELCWTGSVLTQPEPDLIQQSPTGNHV